MPGPAARRLGAAPSFHQLGFELALDLKCGFGTVRALGDSRAEVPAAESVHLARAAGGEWTMHSDDIEELGELGFGFPMAGVVEVYRKALEQQRERAVPPSEKVRVRRDLEDLHKWQIRRVDWLQGSAARAN